ncbi:RNA-binding protein [Verrucomicrobiales bacterium]|nr:RNA-binding protein [Verrucomicrobiales bacterium]MDB2496454.1 RNA-binding protein [Verrucomicrobiales bacterium]MDC3352550.1 RNA-binding protein [Verrucomicrobiales bacterium]
MKLYIGNLPFETSETELREFLAEYEPIVDLHMPLDRDTGRPRGFAFVTLSSREIGEKAVENLDGADCGGRSARVREAEDRPRGGGGHRSGGRDGGGGHRGGGGGRDEGYRGDGNRGGGRSDDGKRYRSL